MSWSTLPLTSPHPKGPSQSAVIIILLARQLFFKFPHMQRACLYAFFFFFLSCKMCPGHMLKSKQNKKPNSAWVQFNEYLCSLNYAKRSYVSTTVFQTCFKDRRTLRGWPGSDLLICEEDGSRRTGRTAMVHSHLPWTETMKKEGQRLSASSRVHHTSIPSIHPCSHRREKPQQDPI